ncbi:protein Red-like [Artemia franciscana]|uniref:Protein Red n=1 Tax=Artemia franciscana TaxID=6661 RepID=A0AA88I3Y8_ARTSF|nr:hypothetical protein QYM36_009824 [Artemia franciscana]KAK2714954.1 hypothetical protein QYM36_009824 [Artemia franciscana]
MEDSHKLTNEDFRKLLMTPRAPSGSTIPSTPASSTKERLQDVPSGNSETSKAEARRRKKLLYAKIKKEEEDQMAELAKKYRDRARERRDGINPDYNQAEDTTTSGGAYKAVAPDIRSNINAAERRRQQIQESKYLGGDMEHTHLVKGLDYALLQKVRTEIMSREAEENGEDLDTLLQREAETAETMRGKEEEMQIRSKLARNVYRTIFKTHIPPRNELFLPGRMAYVMDIEDDIAESDIPTTLIRSKADIPTEKLQTTLTTNDIVINKLSQILSYLRAGGKKSKKEKAKKDKSGKAAEERVKPVDDSIYGEIGDYVAPITTEEKQSRERERTEKDARSRDRERYVKEEKRTSYFGGEDREKREQKSTVIEEAESTLGNMLKPQDGRKPEGKTGIMAKLTNEPEGYAECYPGFEEMQDAIVDSDEEVDYTKMDAGNKKGPIGRWDFDTAEEYSDYMANKEALPKAAFQYGVKMADGRKTRKVRSEKNEKAELDREWSQIQKIIQKRKGDPSDGRSSKMPKM